MYRKYKNSIRNYKKIKRNMYFISYLPTARSPAEPPGIVLRFPLKGPARAAIRQLVPDLPSPRCPPRRTLLPHTRVKK